METDRKTIFLVDDNMTNLTIGNDTLSDFYNVFSLNSGPRLLKILDRHIPDLILLDVEMPEMNGYETIQHIKAKPETRHIPVIFLTGKSDSKSELTGLSLGAIDYITKPFSPPLLLKRIEVHLLVESQKQELIHFNNNLQAMVDTKTETVVELQNAVLKTMAELVEYRDDVTGAHIDRTQSYLKVLLGELLEQGLYPEETSLWDMDLVLQSSQLHDVGKIATPDAILQKPGKLTPEEFEIIKGHTTFGEEIIERIKKNTTEHAFLDYAKVLVGTHHEKWDGSGYPKGLKGREIPLLGRMMALVDVYDALVSARPYKKAFAHQEARDIIVDGKGTHFDPDCVELFLGVADQFQEIALSHKEKARRF
ncbi:MAG: response regulator [Peptococcaceae bacterium]|nr:response regulator [Peptococcaceae bacterium]